MSELYGLPLMRQVLADIAAGRAADKTAHEAGGEVLSPSDLIHARAVERAHREKRKARTA